MSKKLRAFKKAARNLTSPSQPRCGLCGKTDNLTRTECCDQWICDDEVNYRLFSYAHNSCHRNHRRYTLCGYHHSAGHSGDWQTCPTCREDFKDRLEMYVYFGTNEYNFETLKNPPKYERTRCSRCGAVIALGREGFSVKAGKYLCEVCTRDAFPDLIR